jgi:hypothetical protein
LKWRYFSATHSRQSRSLSRARTWRGLSGAGTMKVSCAGKALGFNRTSSLAIWCRRASMRLVMPEEMLDEGESKCRSRDSNEGGLLVILEELDMLCEIMVLKTLCDVCSVRRRVEFEDGFSQSQKVGFTSTTTATNSTAQQALFLDAPVKPRNNQ